MTTTFALTAVASALLTQSAPNVGHRNVYRLLTLLLMLAAIVTLVV